MNAALITPRTLIIAEAGVNHNGDLETAKQLVKVAAEAGADYVKFQSYKTDKLVSQQAEKAAYQKQFTPATESQYEMLKRLELSEAMHEELVSFCAQHSIGFLSSVFDEESLALVHRLTNSPIKIPSGELTNYPLLEAVGALQKEVILSTGMAYLEEVEQALQVLEKAGTSRNLVCVLQCTSQYPAPAHEANLRAMQTMATTLGVRVGYSDHTIGIGIALAAVALGATVIEKHFTLDKAMSGPDHQASLSPTELKELVSQIRIVEQALGNGSKAPSASETDNRLIARKSIHLKHSLPANTLISAENLVLLRPGDGLQPADLKLVAGKRTLRALPANHKLSLKDVAQ